jgi:hypothetical protein
VNVQISIQPVHEPEVGALPHPPPLHFTISSRTGIPFARQDAMTDYTHRLKTGRRDGYVALRHTTLVWE